MSDAIANQIGRLIELGVVTPVTTAGDTQYTFADTFIAGFRYGDGPDIMPYLQPGERLDLIAEPGNPHDEWAIRIEHRKSRIGYVPRSINRVLNMLLQGGAKLEAEIAAVDGQAPPWECVRVKVSAVLSK